jgi:hypothetical protein
VAQVVEQRQLDGQAHRVPQGELDDREADPHAAGAHRHRRRERDRVAVDGLAGEVVLGEPDAVEAGRLGVAGLGEQIVDGLAVGLGRGRVGQREPAEPHPAHRLTTGGVVQPRAARSSARRRSVAAVSTVSVAGSITTP